MVGVYATANGYHHQLKPTMAVFNVSSADVHKNSCGDHKSSHRSSYSSNSGVSGSSGLMH